VTVRSMQVMADSGRIVDIEGTVEQRLEAHSLSAEASTQVYILN
jgi:hypothetical protein